MGQIATSIFNKRHYNSFKKNPLKMTMLFYTNTVTGKNNYDELTKLAMAENISITECMNEMIEHFREKKNSDNSL